MLEQAEPTRTRAVARELIAFTSGTHGAPAIRRRALRQELPTQKIDENRRDVRGIAVLGPSSGFCHQTRIATAPEAIDVRSGYHGATAGLEELSDICQKVDGTLDVLDDFDGNDQVEDGRSDCD